MKTVIETPIFQKQAASIWTEEERLDFIQIREKPRLFRAGMDSAAAIAAICARW